MVKAQRIAKGVYRVALGGVSAFLVETDDGIVLIDAGLRRSPARIIEALHELDRSRSEVRAIVVTHLHRDHTGGLAAIKRETGADVWMHPADAALVRGGVAGRPLDSRGGLPSRLVARLWGRRAPSGEAVEVEHEVSDGEVLPFAGLLAVHTPGHTAGHLALLLPREGGVLFVGDAASNMTHLGRSIIQEDSAESGRSLAKLAALDFDVAAFSHGRPIRARAAERFRARWAPKQ